MTDKESFNKIEKLILRVMYQQKIYFTAYEVGKSCKISYPTAKKYLLLLLKDNVVIKHTEKESYIFNFELFKYDNPKKFEAIEND